MAASAPQNLENHARLVFGYHIAATLLLVVNLGFAGWMVVTDFSVAHVVYLGTAIALILVGFYARVFALAVQDRLIRLEERMRLQKLLPQDMQSRIEDFSVPQLIALRFASDGELPALAKRVLDEQINDRTAIKKLITNWRADECRA